MKTILFIAPHLSTGGLPQYLCKKVESLISSCNVYVLEYEDITGGVLVVQKNKLRNLLGDKLISIPWGGDKNQVISIINEINPNIIHFEEMPEYFMDDSITRQIYNNHRTYTIFETSHDSSFNPDNKRFFPDKFILVSNYQVKLLAPLGIPSEVVEYPIEYQERPDRQKALEALNLNPLYKHVLHVGLFTPRKNQSEFFDYAKNFIGQNVIFHSVGNMADNFKYYWEPLVNEKPENVIIWGERNDVDKFYSAMDLFLFTSRGTINDKETMPLVIREAISWNIPTLIYNLPVYENYFDKFDAVKYLSFDSKDLNITTISSMINSKPKNDAVIISAYPTSKSSIELTLKSIKAAKSNGYYVILVSHAPVSLELQESADYVVYDSNNLLTYHDYYSSVFFDYEHFRLDMNLKTENNHLYHGPAVYTNYVNGITAAKQLGFENAICYNFDMILTDKDVLNTFSSYLETNKAVFNVTKPEEGFALRTVLFGINVDFFLDYFPSIRTESDYNNWKSDVNSQSNGLENIFYNTLKGTISQFKILTDNEFYSLLRNCEIDVCSMVEYFNVVSVNGQPNQFAVWFSTANSKDDRDFTIRIIKDDVVAFNRDFTVKTNEQIYHVFNYDGGNYQIRLYQDGELIKKISIDNEYMNNKLPQNGTLTIK